MKIDRCGLCKHERVCAIAMIDQHGTGIYFFGKLIATLSPIIPLSEIPAEECPCFSYDESKDPDIFKVKR